MADDGSVAVMVVTDARRGRATVKTLSIKINRTLHPYRKSALPLSQGADPTALNQSSKSHNKKPCS